MVSRGKECSVFINLHAVFDDFLLCFSGNGFAAVSRTCAVHVGLDGLGDPFFDFVSGQRFSGWSNRLRLLGISMCFVFVIIKSLEFFVVLIEMIQVLEARLGQLLVN